MDMFFVEMHAVPGPGQADVNVGGAYVNCWIKATDEDDAVGRARAQISDAGWKPVEFRRAHTTRRADYTGQDEGLQYFEQALLEKEVCVFHCYPVQDELE